MIAAKRPDIEIVGEELHPLGKVKDFLPYATKIRASGAQAVVTGNWGNDLTLLVKAREGRAAGQVLHVLRQRARCAGCAGRRRRRRRDGGRRVAPEFGDRASERSTPRSASVSHPAHDYVHTRMQVMIEMLVAAMERARSADPVATARALEGMRFDGAVLNGLHTGAMRAGDHQFQQPLVVSVMERAGSKGVGHDVEGSGFGFRTVRRFAAEQVEMPHACRMIRPD